MKQKAFYVEFMIGQEASLARKQRARWNKIAVIPTKSWELVVWRPVWVSWASRQRGWGPTPSPPWTCQASACLPRVWRSCCRRPRGRWSSPRTKHVRHFKIVRCLTFWKKREETKWEKEKNSYNVSFISVFSS